MARQNHLQGNPVTKRHSCRLQKQLTSAVVKLLGAPSTAASGSALQLLAAFRTANFSIDFLIDTGSSISLLPVSMAKLLNCLLAPSPICLKAADGRSLVVQGQTHLKLTNASLRRSFIWVFVVADVSKPILGADFLLHFRISVDCFKRTIIDTNTKLCAPCIPKLVPDYAACGVRLPDNLPVFVTPLLEKYAALLMPGQVDYSAWDHGLSSSTQLTLVPHDLSLQERASYPQTNMTSRGKNSTLCWRRVLSGLPKAIGHPRYI